MNKYLEIVKHYENCLDKYGDSHLGVDWPNASDAQTRYRIMEECIFFNTNEKFDKRLSILDFGCGASHFYEYLLNSKRIKDFEYIGVDLSPKFIDLCNRKYPDNQYYCYDILNYDPGETYDYIIANGVFTEKVTLTFDEMFDYFKKAILKLYNLSNKGLAFNVMSEQVDWKREDLFHLPFDSLAAFLCSNVTRKFIFRNDYGLYEYTVYIYK